jgi:alkylation response protein AidB-like acyl-CoA dehydrogenase
MGTLAFERGASTLGQQLGFEYEVNELIEAARRRGVIDEPVIRQRISDVWLGLRIMRYNALRSMTSLEGGELTPLTSVHKLYWATLHRTIGALAIDVLGPEGLVLDDAPYELTEAQRLFLVSRADTIYGGSNQIQRNVIGEQALGLPKEPR